MENFNKTVTVIGVVISLIGITTAIFSYTADTATYTEDKLQMSQQIEWLELELKVEKEKNLLFEENLGTYVTQQASTGELPELENNLSNIENKLNSIKNTTDAIDESLEALKNNTGANCVKDSNNPDYTIAIFSSSAIIGGAIISGMFGLISSRYKNSNSSNLST